MTKAAALYFEVNKHKPGQYVAYLSSTKGVDVIEGNHKLFVEWLLSEKGLPYFSALTFAHNLKDIPIFVHKETPISKKGLYVISDIQFSENNYGYFGFAKIVDGPLESWMYGEGAGSIKNHHSNQRISLCGENFHIAYGHILTRNLEYPCVEFYGSVDYPLVNFDNGKFKRYTVYNITNMPWEKDLKITSLPYSSGKYTHRVVLNDIVNIIDYSKCDPTIISYFDAVATGKVCDIGTRIINPWYNDEFFIHIDEGILVFASKNGVYSETVSAILKHNNEAAKMVLESLEDRKYIPVANIKDPNLKERAKLKEFANSVLNITNMYL